MAEIATRPARGPLSVIAHPIYPVLLPIPIICFIGALITDLAYTSAPDMMWIDFSSWLLLAGLIGAGFAAVVLIIELVRAGAARRGTLTVHFILLVSAMVVEILNSFIHARDGWTAVVPTGLWLSVLAAVLSLAAGWTWQSFRRRYAGDAQ